MTWEATLLDQGAGGFGANGTQSFVDNASSRGQAGALAMSETDFGPWGGTLSFNNNNAVNFYFDPDLTTDNDILGFDFYSVAVHELAHLLGFGTVGSYYNDVSGSDITDNAVVSLASPQPSDLGGNTHWQSGYF